MSKWRKIHDKSGNLLAEWTVGKNDIVVIKPQGKDKFVVSCENLINKRTGVWYECGCGCDDLYSYEPLPKTLSDERKVELENHRYLRAPSLQEMLDEYHSNKQKRRVFWRDEFIDYFSKGEIETYKKHTLVAEKIAIKPSDIKTFLQLNGLINEDK